MAARVQPELWTEDVFAIIVQSIVKKMDVLGNFIQQGKCNGELIAGCKGLLLERLQASWKKRNAPSLKVS